MDILWEGIKKTLSKIKKYFIKKKRSKQILKEPLSIIKKMELIEKYKTELFQSISIIPDEMLPFLGDHVYKK